MAIRLKGLTWDHPRATSPLYAAAEPLRRLRPDIDLSWDVQPLAGFEASPIAEAARGYDLIIFDHPHIGEVAKQALFRPADAVLKIETLNDEDFIGPSLASYRYGGHVWGLPLDAACQVSCVRPDLLAELGAAQPTSWSETLEFGELIQQHGFRLGMAYAGVHSLMTLLSLCANQSAPLASGDCSRAFADRSAARKALAAMKALLAFCAREVLDWNSIGVQEAMCARDDLVFCPAVYGFAPYAHCGRRRRLVYGNFAGLVAGGAGSTIGGAGLGVSAFSNKPDIAFAVARFLIDARVQTNTIARHDGQPARSEAWSSSQVNQASGGFYQDTRVTMERAWVRPRFDGYLHFQRAGGELVEAYLRGSTSMESTLDRLEAAWTAARSHAR